MDIPVNEVLMVIAPLLLVISFMLYYWISTHRKQVQDQVDIDDQPRDDAEQRVKTSNPRVDITAQYHGKEKKKSTKLEFHHDLLVTTLKGHQGPIHDVKFSSDGAILASCSEDQTVRLWRTTSVGRQGKELPYSRINIKLDCVTACAFSPDDHLFASATADSKKIMIYPVELKDNKVMVGEPRQFPSLHKLPIRSLVWGPKGSFILTCVKGTDTQLHLCGPGGAELLTINTRQLQNHMATISPKGRFLAVATTPGEIKIWEIIMGKTGDFETVDHVMDLKGLKKGVASLGFTKDEKLLVTGSIDGSLRVWNIAVRYQQKEDPKLVCEGPSGFDTIDNLAISPDDDEKRRKTVIVVSSGTSISFLSLDLKPLQQIHDIHTGGVRAINFSADGRLLASCRDKLVQVFRVPSA